MGLCSSCWICPCLSKKSSVIVCTFLYAIMFILSACILILRPRAMYILVFYVLVVVSLVLVVIGIKKRKRGFLAQFKWGFGTYVVLITIGGGLLVALFVYLFLLSSNTEDIQNFRKYMPNNEQYSDDIVSSSMKMVSVGGSSIIIVSLIITWNYFLFTWGYAKNIIEEIDNEKSMMNYEAGNPLYLSSSGIQAFSPTPQAVQYAQAPQNVQYDRASQTVQYAQTPQNVQYGRASQSVQYAPSPQFRYPQYQQYPQNVQYSQQYQQY